MRTKTMWLVAAVIATTTACASARDVFKQPEVTLKDVTLNGIGFSGGSIDVLLNVYNPNAYNLDATKMTYRVFVDTTEFGNGTIDSRFTVQEKDSTTVRIPVNFTWAGVGTAARSLFDMGTVNYRVLGEVTVSTALGEYRIPYDRTGRFTTTGGRE